MCFSPQRRTIFQHLNFQKWSRTLSFLSFLLPNVLFATAACNFWCHLSAPTSAPAALTGLLLDWPDTRIYEKTQHFVTSLTFGACVSSFLLTFWLLHLLSTDLITLLLLFNSPYCRKFLFKLPSINTGWWFQIFFIFIPTWQDDPIWTNIFSDGLKPKPPTRIYSIFPWIRHGKKKPSFANLRGFEAPQSKDGAYTWWNRRSFLWMTVDVQVAYKVGP